MTFPLNLTQNNQLFPPQLLIELRFLIKVGQIKALDEGKAQTLQSRRKRFRNILTQLLEKEGWQQIRANLYIPKSMN